MIGPLYALGAALTLGCLWLNAIGGYIPEEGVPNWFRTVALVSIDFLIPGHGPGDDRAGRGQDRRRAGPEGRQRHRRRLLPRRRRVDRRDVPGRLLPDEIRRPTTIVTLVAAGLALMATFLLGDKIGLILGRCSRRPCSAWARSLPG